MKKIISLIFLTIIIAGYSCSNEQKPVIPEVDYCLELKLVDGSLVLDTFKLLQGTELTIGTYKGGYGICVTTSCLFDLYGLGARIGDVGFLRFGVIDYKITDIILDENTFNRIRGEHRK